MRILLAEDDDMVASIVKHRLRKAGHLVEHVTDGTEAVRWVEQPAADLVILDIKMPGMDGLQVLRHLRAQPQWRAIPVIILTALGNEEDLERGFDLGADLSHQAVLAHRARGEGGATAAPRMIPVLHTDVLEAVAAVSVGFVFLCVGLALTAVYLRWRNLLVARMWKQVEDTWEEQILEAMTGTLEPGRIIDRVPGRQRPYFVGFLSRFVERVRGPERRQLLQLARPLLPS